MAQTAIVGRDDPARPSIEAFIAGLYLRAHQAKALEFPDRLIVATGADGGILCAAGLRTEEDGFFSEVYLNVPVEMMLSGLCGRRVARREIFEISTFASGAPTAISAFVGNIIRFGETNGLSWSFFTATSRLRRIVERLGLTPIRLGDADRRRIAHAERWGDYYLAQPGVFAVTKPVGDTTLGHTERPCRAIAV